jgi:general secretion pathway protein N
MRIRLRTRPGVLFGALFVASLVALLPLRLVLGSVGIGEEGLTARRVTGSIWSGRMTEARFGSVALGDLQARLAFWPLLVGRARVELNGRAEAPARPLRGAVSVSRHRIGVDDLTASVATGRLFAPLPVTGLDLDAVTVQFRDGDCEAAQGRVRATLGSGVGGIALPATVAGDARCDGTALLLPLTSQAGSEGVTLRIAGDGTYTAEFLVRPTDAAAATLLEAAGFTPSASGHRLSVQGRF